MTKKVGAEGLQLCSRALQSGEIVGVPTETVYGLAGNALKADVIAKIYHAKGRPKTNPLIVHVDRTMLSCNRLSERGYVDINQMSVLQQTIADKLIKHFWPGPLTIVLPKGSAIPEEITAGKATVALRMPAHSLFLDLLDSLSFPLAAPSANRANRISPTCADDVVDELSGKIPLVLDGGRCFRGIESTIIMIGPGGDLTVLRPGSLMVEEIESVAQARVQRELTADKSGLSPGQSPVHYSPSLPHCLLSRSQVPPKPWLDAIKQRNSDGPCVGVLLLGDQTCPESWAAELKGFELIIKSFQDQGDGVRASSKLYQYLRELDRYPQVGILSECPEDRSGLWDGFLDRLNRAAAFRARS